jgi:hypothetical protein
MFAIIYESLSSPITTVIASEASVACVLYSGKYGRVDAVVRGTQDFDSHLDGRLSHHCGGRMICA